MNKNIDPGEWSALRACALRELLAIYNSNSIDWATIDHIEDTLANPFLPGRYFEELSDYERAIYLKTYGEITGDDVVAVMEPFRKTQELYRTETIPGLGLIEVSRAQHTGSAPILYRVLFERRKDAKRLFYEGIRGVHTAVSTVSDRAVPWSGPFPRQIDFIPDKLLLL